MNGDDQLAVEMQEDNSLSNIHLSLDATTLDFALGRKPVEAIAPDGTIVLEEPKAVGSVLTEELERIWNEYPNGLLDLTEEQLAALPGHEEAVKGTEVLKDDVEKREPSRSITFEDMEKLRSEVYMQLNDARNELWFVLELVKTLAVSQSFTNQPPANADQHAARKAKPKPVVKPTDKTLPIVPGQTEPPVLPAGTYSTTRSAAPTKARYAQVHDLESVLAAKQQALDECSALIDSAVSELQLVASAADRFWSDVRSLKDGVGGKKQWAVMPKPDFGKVMGEGEKAKDIIIPYAVDETSRITRSRCLAAFDLDPKKKNALTFGARNHLRLRATLKDETGSVSASTLVEPENGTDVRAMMEAAQMEAFDEDLFHEIRGEAHRFNNCEIEPKTIRIPAAQYELTFELYDPRNASAIPLNPLCDLIVAAARLGLLNVLRQRKANLIAPSSLFMLPVPSILQPITQVLRQKQICTIVRATLQQLANALSSAGIEATVGDFQPRHSQQADTDLENLLVGGGDVAVLTGSYALRIPDCHGSTVEIVAPGTVIVNMSTSSFPLSNPEDLLHVLAEDLALQLVQLADRQLRLGLPDKTRRSAVFFDHLEGLIDITGLGLLHMSLPAPFHTVFGRVASPEKQPDDHVSDDECDWRSFAGREGHRLESWVRSLAERIMQT